MYIGYTLKGCCVVFMLLQDCYHKSQGNHLRFGVSKSPVFDFLRQSPTHMITGMIMIIANTAATATTTYSHTSTVVTVGGGVGRELAYRLGCDVTSVWVVDVISSMGVAVTEGEGSLVIGTLAQLGSVWENVFDGQSGNPGLFSWPSSTKETLGMVCDVLPFILN